MNTYTYVSPGVSQQKNTLLDANEEFFFSFRKRTLMKRNFPVPLQKAPTRDFGGLSLP